MGEFAINILELLWVSGKEFDPFCPIPLNNKMNFSAQGRVGLYIVDAESWKDSCVNGHVRYRTIREPSHNSLSF